MREPGVDTLVVVEVARSASECILRGGGVCLRFQWTGDRWTHAIEFEGTDDPVAVSVEFDPARDDLPHAVSPVYQQLETQQAAAGGMQALLVGQFGRRHFSAVFDFRIAAAQILIDVDVAVRGGDGSEILAATYLIDRTSSDLIDADMRRIRWILNSRSREPEPQTLDIAAVEPACLVLREAGRRATHVQAFASEGYGTRSRRLAYRWTATVI